MIVLAWIGQIVLFFLLWRLLHWLTVKANRRKQPTSMVMELVVNLVVAIVVLIVVTNLHSAWWLMGVIGAAVGIFTGQSASREASEV